MFCNLRQVSALFRSDDRDIVTLSDHHNQSFDNDLLFQYSIHSYSSLIFADDHWHIGQMGRWERERKRERQSDRCGCAGQGSCISNAYIFNYDIHVHAPQTINANERCMYHCIRQGMQWQLLVVSTANHINAIYRFTTDDILVYWLIQIALIAHRLRWNAIEYRRILCCLSILVPRPNGNCAAAVAVDIAHNWDVLCWFCSIFINDKKWWTCISILIDSFSDGFIDF